MDNKNTELIGKFGLCFMGKIGYITATKEIPFGRFEVGTRTCYTGIRLDAGGPWQSIHPTILTTKQVATRMKMTTVDVELLTTRLLMDQS